MTAEQATELRVVEMTPAELQAAARDAYRQAAAAGDPPTGADLGQRFGRSARWGRDRIAECRTDVDGNRLATVASGTTAAGSLRAAGPVDRNGSGSHEAQSVESGSHGKPAAAGQSPVRTDNQSTDSAGMWSRRLIRWVTTAAVIVVAACAARSSYEHQRAVVEMAGNQEAAWYLPLSVDGMMLIASLNMLVRRWENQPAGWLTWTALLLGGAASLAANIAAAPPTWIGRLVAAWSPVCLIVSYELLMQQLPNRSTAAGHQRRQPQTTCTAPT